MWGDAKSTQAQNDKMIEVVIWPAPNWLKLLTCLAAAALVVLSMVSSDFIVDDYSKVYGNHYMYQDMRMVRHESDIVRPPT